LTTSSYKNAINAYENAIDISHTLQQDETIFTIHLRQNQPLQTFSFNVFQKDTSCNCDYSTQQECDHATSDCSWGEYMCSCITNILNSFLKSNFLKLLSVLF
jgi:hypothetical protein